VTVDFLATVSNGVRFREHVELAELKLLIPAVIVGILSGVTLLAMLPKHAALLLLGHWSPATACTGWRPNHRPNRCRAGGEFRLE